MSRHPISLALYAVVLVVDAMVTGSAWAQSAPEPATVETGFGLGIFSLADDHELYASRTREVRPLQPGPMLTWRGAYLPARMLGVEVEIDVVRLVGSADTTATVVVPRAHLLLQLPTRVAPFAVAGAGMLISTSRALGDDTDPMGYAGAGVKFYWREGVSLRADARLVRSSRAERDDGGKGTNHLQVSVGFAWAFGSRGNPTPAPRRRATPPPDPAPPVAAAATLGPDTSVWFALNQHDLDDAGRQVLDQVAARMVADPRIGHVRIEGHADDDGSHADNILLSARRAQRVKQYLVSRGVAGDRLISRGVGSSRAQIGESANNRRVDMSIEHPPAPDPGAGPGPKLVQ